MASNAEERAREYREIAAKLRLVAGTAKESGAKAELTWLAQSYERLAAKVADSEASWLTEDALPHQGRAVPLGPAGGMSSAAKPSK